MSKLERLVRDNISEYREFIVWGQSGDVSASLMCGMREVDYKINGIATDLIEFGVLTIGAKDESLLIAGVEYILFVGTKKYSGELEKNPFNGTLVADIKEVVDENSNISLVIKFDDGDIPIKLQKVNTKWGIDSEGCIDILMNKYNGELKKFVNNGVFEGEVYIKIMQDDIFALNDFYYLVSVYGKEGKSINVILSPISGEILASNVKI